MYCFTKSEEAAASLDSAYYSAQGLSSVPASTQHHSVFYPASTQTIPINPYTCDSLGDPCFPYGDRNSSAPTIGHSQSYTLDGSFLQGINGLKLSVHDPVAEPTYDSMFPWDAKLWAPKPSETGVQRIPDTIPFQQPTNHTIQNGGVYSTHLTQSPVSVCQTPILHRDSSAASLQTLRRRRKRNHRDREAIMEKPTVASVLSGRVAKSSVSENSSIDLQSMEDRYSGTLSGRSCRTQQSSNMIVAPAALLSSTVLPSERPNHPFDTPYLCQSMIGTRRFKFVFTFVKTKATGDLPCVDTTKRLANMVLKFERTLRGIMGEEVVKNFGIFVSYLSHSSYTTLLSKGICDSLDEHLQNILEPLDRLYTQDSERLAANGQLIKKKFKALEHLIELTRLATSTKMKWKLAPNVKIGSWEARVLRGDTS